MGMNEFRELEVPHLEPDRMGFAMLQDRRRRGGVGTALDGRSRVWVALSHGIVDEVYYPRVDEATTRDMGLLVTVGVEMP